MASDKSSSCVKIEKVAFYNQPDCYMISNGLVEVIVTTNIGPRVIGYRFCGGENIFAELPSTTAVTTEYGTWHACGGHRLWHAPEVKPRSYMPDNDAVKFEIIDNDTIRLMTAVEAATGIEKEMLVKLDSRSSKVTVTHKLTNRGLWSVELAPWALTIVRGGGEAIIPNEQYISHDDVVLPARPLALWHFTDLSDSRWTFGCKYIRLRSDSALENPQKIGVGVKQGWAGFIHGETFFLKKFPYVDGANYPDYGSNCEIYTEGSFMEVETLGPLATVEPEQSVIHIEDWFLFDGVRKGKTDSDLDAAIMPLVESANCG